MYLGPMGNHMWRGRDADQNLMDLLLASDSALSKVYHLQIDESIGMTREMVLKTGPHLTALRVYINRPRSYSGIHNWLEYPSQYGISACQALTHLHIMAENINTEQDPYPYFITVLAMLRAAPSSLPDVIISFDGSTTRYNAWQGLLWEELQREVCSRDALTEMYIIEPLLVDDNTVLVPTDVNIRARLPFALAKFGDQFLERSGLYDLYD
ncbi:hypothetical protein EUX98_g2770 [Antrodiella citrinella]|uniref:Uncharacterized protein n=1 Tax=Antrodiella citrinella TaxID=2447956 RepID=A0A4S4N0Z5_9APHY|nr:hypothetical protein EUX98_g2770 [Antrodiella citrinella]